MKPSTSVRMILFIIFFNGYYANAQTTEVVTKCKSEGWVIDNNSQSKITFAKPPTVTTIGGSGLEFMPTGTNPVKIRLSTYNNTLLKDIATLTYSTNTNSDNKFTAFLALHVEFTTSILAANVNRKDTAIILFEPGFQDNKHPGNGKINSLTERGGNVQKNIWQDWDCLSGVWWVNYNPLSNAPLTEAPFYQWSEFVTIHPDARLVYWPNAGGNAIRLSAGGGNTPIIPALVCYADNFTIGIKGKTKQPVIYHFEYREQCPNGAADLLNKYKIYLIILILLIPAALFFIKRTRRNNDIINNSKNVDTANKETTS